MDSSFFKSYQLCFKHTISLHTYVKIYTISATEQSLVPVYYTLKKCLSFTNQYFHFRCPSLQHSPAKIPIAGAAKQSWLPVCFNGKKSFNLTDKYLFV